MHARRTEDQLLEIPAIQRQVRHLRAGDKRTDAGIGSFHLRRLTFHRDGLGLLPDRKREVDHALAADRQRNAAANHRREAGLGGLHFVIADAQIGHREAPLRIAYGGLGDTGSDVFHLNRSFRDRGAG